MSASSQRAVVLLSGGLDSVVAAALWLDGGGQIARCLTMDYAQRAASREFAAAARFCQRHALSHERLALPWLAALSRQRGTALVNTAQQLPQGTLANPGDERSAKAVWVPEIGRAHV